MIDASSLARTAAVVWLVFIGLLLLAAAGFLVKGIHDATPVYVEPIHPGLVGSRIPLQPLRPGIAAFGWAFALVGVAELWGVKWAWRANHRVLPLGASLLTLVAAGFLIGCASTLQQATACTWFSCLDSPAYPTTLQDAQGALVASICAAVGTALLGLASLEEAVR